MRILNGKHDGSLVVENDSLQIYGMIAGDLVVRDRAVVHLHGMVCGDVFVEGGQLDLHGMVDGNVRNLGGQLRVFGSIHGSLFEVSGTTSVDPNAVVRP
jgi:cytoskeletal protein CcmA (bactofilin family)